MQIVEPFTVLAAFNVALTLLGALGAWGLKQMSANLRDLKTSIAKCDTDVQAARHEVSDVRLYIAERYVRTDDYKAALDAIFNALRRIEDDLKDKQDKALRFRPATGFGDLGKGT